MKMNSIFSEVFLRLCRSAQSKAVLAAQLLSIAERRTLLSKPLYYRINFSTASVAGDVVPGEKNRERETFRTVHVFLLRTAVRNGLSFCAVFIR